MIAYRTDDESVMIALVDVTGTVIYDLSDDERDVLGDWMQTNIGNFIIGLEAHRKEKESAHGLERQDEGMGRG